MAIYRYIALNRKGKEQKGIIDASTPVAARKTLRAQGLFVRSITQDIEKKEREMFPALTKMLYRVPRRDVGLFARQLGTLLDAGLPLDRSLANIIEQVENEYLKKALIEIRSSIVEGGTLSEAMRKHSGIFPPVYYNLVAVGEKTGTYEKALLRLADLEEANQELKNKVMTAAFYPIIMLVLLGGIVLFLLGVVFPQIEQLFAQVDAELPLITRVVIGLSNFITSIWMPVTMAGLAILFMFFYRWKKTPDGQRTWERFVLKQPLFGSLGRKYLLATFARNLGVMLQNRVPLIAALQVVGDVVNHGLFGDEIRRAIERIKEGSRITESLQDSIIINQMMLGMLSAGEAADRVPEMVTRIADVMDGELDGTIQRLSSMLEPIMIVVMGGLIVVIMLAILLPMYRLTESLQM